MATDKQIHANRLNAQKSTGPKSPEGKKRVAQNRTKHGLAGEHVVLADEDQSAFDGLLANLMDEWTPQSETEAFLVETLAHNQWRLLRCMRMEKTAFLRQMKNLAGAPLFDTPMSIDDITRYEGRASRAYHRALDTLRKLQAERRKLEAAAAPQQLNAAHPEAPAVAGETAPPAMRQPVIPLGRSNPIHPVEAPLPDPQPEAA